MLYNEVSAANLNKVDINGNILDQGVTLLVSRGPPRLKFWGSKSIVIIK